MTKGEGQTDTQVPLYKAAPEEHPIQLLTVPEHVAHCILQESQVLVTEFGMVVPDGQLVEHVLL